MHFNDMGLIAPIVKALQEEGYETPTPIQAQAIQPLLAGRDLLGCAQTGTGKTAAFSLPILQTLYQNPVKANGRKPIRALILTPTRELAIQIEESLKAYGRHLPLRHQVIFGGVNQHGQVLGLQKGVDILVATPGRLLDLVQQGHIGLHQVEIFVLDEADRMLDMGFVQDVKRVITKLPTQRQTLFFSATMPGEIADLAHRILQNPVKVEVAPVSSTAEKVSQQLYFVGKNNKKHLLQHLLKTQPNIDRLLVFNRTKHGANRIVGDLQKAGFSAAAIHGNKSQNARQQALLDFKNSKVRVLVATDIAARGIDIDDLGFVLNYDLPNIPETYVHRIGRTGRAGASGLAFSFCDAEEKAYLKDIQKLIKINVPVVEEHPFTDGADVIPVSEPAHKTARSHRDRARQQQNRNKPGWEDNQQKPKQAAQQQNGNAGHGQQQKKQHHHTGSHPVKKQQQHGQPAHKKQQQQPIEQKRPVSNNNNGFQRPQKPKTNKPALEMPKPKQLSSLLNDAVQDKPMGKQLFADDDRW